MSIRNLTGRMILLLGVMAMMSVFSCGGSTSGSRDGGSGADMSDGLSITDLRLEEGLSRDLTGADTPGPELVGTDLQEQDLDDTCANLCGNGVCDRSCGEDRDPDFCQVDCCLCGDGICEPSHCGEDWGTYLGLWTCSLDCAICGNKTCEPGEGPVLCKADCCGTCGDRECRCNETPETCINDCTFTCGDNECSPGENPEVCPNDCARYACGNTMCEPGEDPQSCPRDCAGSCGDCKCEGGESYISCPKDCGYCGDGYCINSCAANPETYANCPSDCGENCAEVCATRECGAWGLCFCGECNDGDLCTLDLCNKNNSCEYPPDDCDDDNSCTTDSCSTSLGCVNQKLTGQECDDGNPCTEGDICNQGVCMASSWKDCNDDLACTEDTCSPISGCENVPIPGACDDQKECTTDLCDLGTGCRNEPLELGTPCGTGAPMGCIGGECQCIPQCDDRECGDDGCNGTCGYCDSNVACQDGTCLVSCGDSLCHHTESSCTCPEDCGLCDGCCDGEMCRGGYSDELCGSLGEDCLDCTLEQMSCSNQQCDCDCGDQLCCPGETCSDCPGDCGECCGNGSCDEWETCVTCPYDCGQCQVNPGFLPIDAGAFWMGSPGGEDCPNQYLGSVCQEYGGTTTAEPGRGPYENLHYVLLTHDFELQETEVTQSLWQEVFQNWNPSEHKTCGGQCPVEMISWLEAVAFANEYSILSGVPECYVFSNIRCRSGSQVGQDYLFCMDMNNGGIESGYADLYGSYQTPYDCPGFRLPTEAEWEYAARAGSLTPFYPASGSNGEISHTGISPLDFNLSTIGWYGGNSAGTLHPTGYKSPNDLGLRDMSGNVWEWCWDWYNEGNYDQSNYFAPSEDPSGPNFGTSRVKRGGGWNDGAASCRNAARGSHSPQGRTSILGFRLARTR